MLTVRRAVLCLLWNYASVWMIWQLLVADKELSAANRIIRESTEGRERFLLSSMIESTAPQNFCHLPKPCTAQRAS